MGFEVYTNARDSALRNGERAQELAYQSQQRNALQAAGESYAGGDQRGAVNMLARSGNISQASALDQNIRSNTASDLTAANAAKDRQKATVLAGATGLLRLPEAQWQEAYRSRVAPALEEVGLGDYARSVSPENLTRQEIESIVISLGGELPQAPSGYRYASGGALEAIPGGPAAAENQRWQVTPYGLIPPPGWSPAQGQGGQPEYVDQLPPGVRPRPNPAPSARSSGGAEMSQPTTVNFSDPSQARSAIAQAVPGVGFTSGTRSPADNRRVGGVPTSNHVRGKAWDLTPPGGMSMAQLAQRMRQQGFRALDEGDHVHVSW